MTIETFGDDLLRNLLTFAMDALPGGIGAGISIAGATGSGSGEDAKPRMIAGVGVAEQLDAAQWNQAAGPVWEAFRTGQAVVRPGPDQDADGVDPVGLGPVHDLPAETLRPVRGAVFSPGEWGGELPVVLSVYLDRVPEAAALRQLDRWEPLVSQALSMVEYCSGREQVAEQMLQMTQYRRVIEQAKGMVMGAIGGDADAAFATLARASQHFNVRLRNLAVALVEHVGVGQAEHPPDPDLVVRPSEAEMSAAERVWAALATSTAILPATPTAPVRG